MPCTQEFVDYVIDQTNKAGEITAKAMFGGFHVYSDGKLYALIVNDELYVKATEGGRAFIGDVVEAAAFPRAKVLSFLIEDKLDDNEWLSELVKITVAELPEEKPKKKKAKK